MATVLTIGTAISEAKQLPADGRCYCLPCGLEAIHFPANKMHAESVIVRDGENGCRTIARDAGGWRRPDVISWSSAKQDRRYVGYADGQR